MRPNVRLRLTVVLAAAVIAVGSIALYMSAFEERGPKPFRENILDLESRKSFDFFWKEANTDKSSPGYGLIRDRAPGNPELTSVASVGFGLTAIAIGADRKWISKDEARERASGTLSTLLLHAEQKNGFFYHFLKMNDAKRSGKSEVSIIDTAIAVNGALTAGEYFGGDVKSKAEELYKRIDWEWFRDPDRNMFHMAYSPEDGFKGRWDFYAEQLMLYILAAGSPTHPTNPGMFYSFQRDVKSYGGGKPFIHSWFGSLFTYQYSHAWFDFRGKKDKQGVNWWENSVIATKANLQFSVDQSKQYRTLGPNAWGLTAADGPKGYEGRYGAAPSGVANDQHYVDGTVPPSGAAGSIVFAPAEAKAALEHYSEIPELWGEYGFKDAYNSDVTPAWFDKDVIGIDKGITLLMIENYRDGFVWNTFMKNKFVRQGAEKIGMQKE